MPDGATLARLAEGLGLDRPLPVRYLAFLGDLLSGDLGLSFATRTPVAPRLVDALAVSAALVGLAMTLGLLGGVLLGTLSAARPDGPVDRLVTAGSRLLVSVPEFVSGPLLVLLLTVEVDALPAGGWGTPEQAVLPVVTTALLPLALVAALVRVEVAETLQEPWVRAADARGLPRARVVRAALRCSAASVTGLASLFVPGLLGGAVVVEVVFGVPGLGRLLYDAVLAGDLPVAQAGLLLLVAVTAAATVLADLLRAALDSRLRERVAA